MSATALKQRLREDLKAAMQARASDEIRLLRTLIATLDNAEAVPVGDPQNSANPQMFGVAAGEVARRLLDDDEIESVLWAEAESRLAAAADYERHGRSEDASRLRDEAAMIARYRAS